jgi:hypothetical protein
MRMRVTAAIAFIAAMEACGGTTADATPDVAPDADDDAAIDANAVDVDTSDTTPFCPDIGHDLGATLTLDCSAPLSESASFDAPPIAEWCVGANGLGYFTSGCECGGMLAIYVGVGTDCYREYLFDASTRILVAQLEACIGPISCSQGPAKLVLSDSGCFGMGSNGALALAHHDWPAGVGCP